MNAPTIEATPTRSKKRSVSPEVWEKYNQTGHGSESEQTIIEKHLPLVKTIVGRLALTLPSHVAIEDLHSAGLVGLLEAVRRFDASAGVQFESYARLRIRGAVFDEMRKMDWVPRSVHEKARKVEAVMARLEQENGATPTEEEVAAAMDLNLHQYRKLLEEIRPASFICLDSVRSTEEEDGVSPHEMLADATQTDPGDAMIHSESVDQVKDVLQNLPERQRKVLALYYFEDLRLKEIAAVFGVTEARICQIHAQAILAIKNRLRRLENQPLTP